MLAMTVRNTKKLVRQKVKEENVRLGNRFTKEGNAALCMSLLDIEDKETVYVLDPGAGTGIMSAASVEAICKKTKNVSEIVLVCYENNPVFIPMLEDNLERIRKKCRHDYKIKLRPYVLCEDFVLSEKRPRDVMANEDFSGFDFVLLNPPCDLCQSDSPYAKAKEKIVSGAIDLAYIFTALAFDELREGGEMCVFLPTQSANSAYLSKFRNYILGASALTRIHVFVDKAKEGKEEKIRKTVLYKFVKGAAEPENTEVSTCYGDECEENITVLPPLPYRFVVREKNSITLAKSLKELRAYIFIASLPNTVSSLGLRAHTGLTLESRYPEFIFDSPGDGRVPLISPKNVSLGYIDFEKSKKYIYTVIPSLSQMNKNMLLVKRLPSHSDARHLMCAVYLASQLYGYDKISTHNKLNYLDYEDRREMSSAMVMGLFALFSSSVYEKYCTVVFADNCVSISDFNTLPLPAPEVIEKIGKELAQGRIFSSRACDNLVNSALCVPENLK